MAFRRSKPMRDLIRDLMPCGGPFESLNVSLLSWLGRLEGSNVNSLSIERVLMEMLGFFNTVY